MLLENNKKKFDRNEKNKGFPESAICGILK